MGVHRTCGEPNEIKKNTHPNNITALFREQAYHGVSELVDYEVFFAALVLGFVYVLIIFELIHRTLSAMLGSFITLGVLSILNKRPSLETVVEWIDFETIMLLFGMMVIVGVLSETGVFEFAAVKAYV